MKGISLSRLGAVVTTLLVIVLVIIGATQTKKNQDASPATATATIAPSARAGQSPISTRAVTSSASATDYRLGIQLQMISLIEAYYRLEPTDTPETRQQRVAALGLPASALSQLHYGVSKQSCGDHARLRPENPLVQQASVTVGVINLRPADAQIPFIYVTASFIVGQFQGDGTRYPGTATCQAAAQISVAATWQLVDNQPQLLHFTAQEVQL